MIIQETYLISLLLLAGRLRATTFSVNSFVNTFLISRKMTVEKVFFWRRKKKTSIKVIVTAEDGRTVKNYFIHVTQLFLVTIVY